jgi:hypothetical protein
MMRIDGGYVNANNFAFWQDWRCLKEAREDMEAFRFNCTFREAM